MTRRVRTLIVLNMLSMALISAMAIACRYMPQTALGRAAFEGRLDDVRALLDGGADPNEAAATALVAASRAGHAPIVRLLVARGAQVNARSGVNDWPPLMHAIHKGKNDAARALIELGADIHADQEHALHMAAGYGNVTMVRALLAAGADPGRRGGALLAAAVGGAWDIDYTWRGCQPHTEVVKLLLEKAPTLQMDNDPLSRTAVIYAQKKGCSELLALVH